MNQRLRPKQQTDLQRLLDLFSRRERIQVLVLFLVSLLAAFMQTFGVASIFPFINVLLNPGSIHDNQILQFLYQTGRFNDDMTFIRSIGYGAVIIIVLSSFVSALASWMKNHFVQYRNYSLSKRLLAVYLNKPYSFFLQRNTSELSKNVLAEITHFGNTYVFSVFDLLINSFTLLTIIILLFVVNPLVTASIIGAFGLIYGLITWYTRAGLKKSGSDLLANNAERYSSTNEALSSIKITKISHLEHYFINRFDRAAKRFAGNNFFARMVADLPNYFLEALTFGGMILILMVMINRGIEVTAVIPMVSLYAFAGYRIIPELGKVFRAITAIQHNQPILHKIHQDMIGSQQVEPKLSPATGTQANAAEIKFEHSIKLEGLTFQYENTEDDTIRGITLHIPKRSIIGLAGTTGSGKTTLVDLLLGLLEPTGGQILIDSQPLTTDQLPGWQDKIGYVPQEVFLIDNTIRRNIAFGFADDHIDFERVRQAAAIAQIQEFIEQDLPDQYETVVGERGVRLSGGQRQRIGLARAIYRNPEILVLDEATSALDGATEATVMAGIHATGKIQTIIMIAHRLNTLKVCDQIYLLESGEISAQGSYDQLIATNATFQTMAKIK
jgi:ATP-binding cassette subfamily C protein